MIRTVVLAALVAVTALAPGSARAWWNSDWTTRTKVTLNTTASGVETSEAATAFVMPLRLHSGNFDFISAKEDGSDLRVLAGDDKTPLPFVVERYDGINELAVLWVSVPSVAPGSDKNQLFVYAGNAKAPPQTPGAVFPPGSALMLLRFAEADGTAQDSIASLRSDQAVVRERNGLLGSAARLTGPAVTWPADARVRLAAGAAGTVSMWIKPDSVAQGTLLQWGPLRWQLAAGQLAAEIGAVRLAGGTMPASAWAHIALTLAAGKATLYVNGAQAAQADAQEPELQGALSLGEGYAGLIDEVLIEPAARSAQLIKLMAASQGAENKLVTSVKESGGEAAAGESPGYLGILLKNLTTDAWVVIGILMVMFVISVWVMVTKAVLVSRTDRDNRGFMQRFRAATTDLLDLKPNNAQPDSSLYRLYAAGVRELKKRDVGSSSARLSGASIDAVKASIDADLVRESNRLNAQMVLLTIAISGGPFLGLLGTVVGVMITFAAIAAAGDVNVNAIAPGIAAALLATVAGLAVAIPALFGYNYLASRVKTISSDMQIFVDEFVSRVAELYGQR